ncbi:longitudinals lacking protein, isoforms N/O/W/X/Y-like isoform X3 [Calliopsis andreniformis]|uniref:longitudinals lacking protein, isoforms N/O/W/X/Y-like isoform X3 n=1 Tax=Calliopsis andreniformis TaxID=337506 RepID=UPI003FCC3B34
MLTIDPRHPVLHFLLERPLEGYKELGVHRRTNWFTKPSKFACPNPNCRSVFAWKRNLTSHLRYQCGQQPRFKCPYCEYVCKVKADIRKHIRIKHQNHDVYVIDIFQSWEVLRFLATSSC